MGQFQKPVCQGGFTVVNMGYDAKVPYVVLSHLYYLYSGKPVSATALICQLQSPVSNLLTS
jgi:hypothetical protein